MENRRLETPPPSDLRSRAAGRLTGTQELTGVACRAANAMAALHALATSPETAADALALLHELQVHQVELDLQAEELQDSRAEIEAVLRRQIELYDFQPTGCFAVDAQLVIREANLRGANMLGVAPDAVAGQGLDTFFSADSARALRDLLASTMEQACSPLTWRQSAVARRPVRASVAPDPSGSGFLVALMSA